MKTEVCVVGGGPAGFVAAIAAARGGAKTTLVESFGFPGGMATAGLVGPISKFNFNGRRVIGGIPWEFVERLAAAGGAIANLPKGIVPFEAEVYRRVAREMLEEAGVECLWQTQVCGEPELAANGAIASVTLSAAGFLSRLEAGVFIDCTASGALLRHHGLGAARSPAGAAQPLSLCFILGGVDTGSLRVVVRDDKERSENPVLRAALERAEAQGRIKSFGGPWVVWGSTIRAKSLSSPRSSGRPIRPSEMHTSRRRQKRPDSASAANSRRSTASQPPSSFPAKTSRTPLRLPLIRWTAMSPGQAPSRSHFSSARVLFRSRRSYRSDARTCSPPADSSPPNRNPSPQSASRRNAWRRDRRLAPRRPSQRWAASQCRHWTALPSGISSKQPAR